MCYVNYQKITNNTLKNFTIIASAYSVKFMRILFLDTPLILNLLLENMLL